MRANSLVERHQALVGDEYLLVRLLGSGGAGLVFEARHRLTATRVAIKLLHQSVPEEELSVQRFLREAQAVATLQSEFIVGFRDLAVGPGGSLLLVMELLEGQTLKELLAAGSLPIQRALRIMADACRGVADAHQAGFVHRDLKPANLYVQASGRCKVLDFGLARRFDRVDPLTGDASLQGTVEYMAPEQVTEQGVVDERTDVFALGVIFFEVLLGRRPHQAEQRVGLMYKIANRDAPRVALLAPQLPAPVSELIDRCLQRERGLRPSSAEDLWQVFKAMPQVAGASRSRGHRWAGPRVLAAFSTAKRAGAGDSTAPCRSERVQRPRRGRSTRQGRSFRIEAGKFWPAVGVAAAAGAGLWFAVTGSQREVVPPSERTLASEALGSIQQTSSPTATAVGKRLAPGELDAVARQPHGLSRTDAPWRVEREGPRTEVVGAQAPRQISGGEGATSVPTQLSAASRHPPALRLLLTPPHEVPDPYASAR